MESIFIKEMEVMKYLLILIMASTLLISGCIDLDDSSSSANSKFYGIWVAPCSLGYSGTGSYGGTLEISSEIIISTFSDYENDDCTGEATYEDSQEYPVTYGQEITTPSGIVATELDIIVEFDDGEIAIFLDLIYRGGNQLYLGTNGDFETRAADIDFDRYYTLK